MVRLFAAPSASVAVAVIVAIAAPSAPFAVAGAAMVGWVLGAAGAPAPSQSNQSPGIPLVRPHGSAGAPTTYVFGNAFPSHSVPKPVPNPKGLIAEAPIWT